MTRRQHLRTAITTAILFVTAIAPAFAQLVPSTRLAQSNWEAAGRLAHGGIPARSTVCQTIDSATYGTGAVDATTHIQTALDHASCTPGTVVSIPAGTYSISGLLQLSKSITVRGAGMGKTILKKSNGAKRDPNAGYIVQSYNALMFVGNATFPTFSNSGTVALTADGAQGATTVSVGAGHGLTAGQFVEVAEDQMFAGGTWATKPTSNYGSGDVANLREVWVNDRIVWLKHRQPVGGATITTSDAGTDTVTTSADHTFSPGSVIHIDGHSGTFSPAASDGRYVVRTVPTSTTFTLDALSDGTDIDITTGGSSGSAYTSRSGDDFWPGPADPNSGPLTWFNRGYGYVYGEVKEIASTTATSITFTTGLTDSYRTSKNAAIATSSTTFLQDAGVEDLTMWQGSDGCLSFRAAAKSWAKNVECLEWLGHGINMHMSHKIHVEGAYIHHGAWPVPGGGGYAFVMGNNSSNILLWNSITRDTNKNIVANAGGAGSVIAYNVFQDSQIWGNAWQEVAANASHFSGPHHVLFEGNYAHNFDSDFTHGSAYSHTALRNWFTGYRDNFEIGFSNHRTIGLAYGSRNMSFVGNLLGLAGQMTGWLADSGTGNFLGEDHNIWKLGYDPQEFQQHADNVYVLPTVIKEGNYDYLSNSIQWVTGPGTIPLTYFTQGVKPAFFGSCPWPWVDTEATTKTYVLPALRRYQLGRVYDVDVDPCTMGMRNYSRRRFR